MTVLNLDETSKVYELECFLATDDPGQFRETSNLTPTKWGAGWLYDGERFCPFFHRILVIVFFLLAGVAYFAGNVGDGVYRLEQDLFDFDKGTAVIQFIGFSALTDNNDGMNCPRAPNPFHETAPPVRSN